MSDYLSDQSKGQKICDNLTLSELRCRYPLCPEPKISLNIKDNVEIQYFTEEGFSYLEVDQMISLKCKNSCKFFYGA